MFAILTYYLDRESSVFSPEAWNDNEFNRRGKCDGLLCNIVISLRGPLEYGARVPRLVYEAKPYAGKGWNKLMTDQVWDEADSNKNQEGRIWVLVQRGFEVCFFEFDVNKFEDVAKQGTSIIFLLTEGAYL